MEEVEKRIKDINKKFDTLIKYYEDQEQYEKCQTLVLYRQYIVPKIIENIKLDDKESFPNLLNKTF